jgi:hypothetical protein
MTCRCACCGGAGKILHRLVHLAAVLVFAHWALTAFDPFLAYCHIAALALLEIYRLGAVAGARAVFLPLNRKVRR